MKKLLLLTAALMLVASLSFAQGGSLGIFADLGGTNCNLSDNAPGLCTYYVVHTLAPCVTASQFYAPQPPCMLAVYLSDTAFFPVTIGSSQSGVAVGYGSPQNTPVAVLAINYFCQALTAPCCQYPVLPDPNVPSGQIEVVDCTSTLLFATGGTGIINPNQSCQCDVANEETTWGSVKALYE